MPQYAVILTFTADTAAQACLRAESVADACEMRFGTNLQGTYEQIDLGASFPVAERVRMTPM